MGTDLAKHLFVLGFPDRSNADTAVAELKSLQSTEFLELTDYAIVSKGVGGELTVAESTDSDPGAKQGALAGATGAAFIALLSTPIGAGAIVAGAGIGAVTGALRDSGFKTKDLEETGRLMQDGRTILIVAVKPEHTDRLRGALDDIPALAAADRRWEAEVPASTKNALRDAIAQYRAEEERATRLEEGV
jgi:uncharacterized membrane protein